MSSNQHNLPNPFNAEIDGDVRVAIISAEWNGHITSALTDGCVETLKKHGLSDDLIDVFHVPGAVELTFGASAAIESGAFDVIIVFGCVIRGGTPHFDYVCQSVTQGITSLNAECDIPVIFGVLTVDTEEQAIERIGGIHGHKGIEAAETALKMHQFAQQIRDL
ncbi:MAG: 6,7-dimethyl-8-ribityllumazine synthase [Muribaculaceae bacterium]|nr:6,7-dimethyl-8-ribityllumazine synthase [Muribaculaceae bacterium]